MRKKFLTTTLVGTLLILCTGCALKDKIMSKASSDAEEVTEQAPEADYIPVNEDGEELPRTFAQIIGLDSSSLSSYNCTEVTGDQVRSAIDNYVNTDCIIIIDSKGDLYNKKEMSVAGDTKAITADPEGRKGDDGWINVGLVTDGDRLCTELHRGDNYIELTVPEDQARLVEHVTDLTALQHKDSDLFIDSNAMYYCELIKNPSTEEYQGIVFSKVN